MRTCPRCHEKKSVEDFYKSKESGNPIGYCRPCRSEAAGESRKRHWDKALAKERQRRVEKKEILNAQARDSQARRRGVVTQYPSEKPCRVCKVTKPADEFYRDSYKRDGLTTVCKDCCKTARHKWTVEHRGKLAYPNWKGKLKWKYGMTPEDYDAMLAGQGGKCKICQTTEPGKNGWHIDHCHKTGKVRGILCGRCNPGLGNFNDDPELLRLAREYLLASV